MTLRCCAGALRFRCSCSGWARRSSASACIDDCLATLMTGDHGKVGGVVDRRDDTCWSKGDEWRGEAARSAAEAHADLSPSSDAKYVKRSVNSLLVRADLELAI